MSKHFTARAFPCALVFFFTLVSICSLRVGAQEEKGAGLVVSPEAKAKDVGLAAAAFCAWSSVGKFSIRQ
jgi:hypothetical protein